MKMRKFATIRRRKDNLPIDKLLRLNNSEKVIVNRVKLNELIFEYQFNSNNKNPKAEKILLRAAEELSKQDEKQNNLVWGVEMSVEDAKIVFADDHKRIIGNVFKLA